MKINAMFITRYDEPDIPELVDAWDEYAIGENPDGYDEAEQKWRHEENVKAFAVVTLEVSERAVMNALYPAPVTVDAKIVSGSGGDQ